MANFGGQRVIHLAEAEQPQLESPQRRNGSDFTQTGTLTRQHRPVGPCSVPFYTVNPAAVPADCGYVFEERPGYHQKY